MPPVKVTISRLDGLYLARVADQAERYQDVISQIKSFLTPIDAQLTVEERNLLSIAYKNITGTLRSSWRTIDTLEKRDHGHSPRHLSLIHVEKDRIKEELDTTCKDVVELMEKFLIPAASPGEEKVFYCKMKGDYYRYLAEFAKHKSDNQYATLSLEAYKLAYKHALCTLDPTHPTRLGLALNFAVYYHDIGDSPERACFLAKHAFDEAIAVASQLPSGQTLEDSLVILQLLRDDMILWSGEIQHDT